MAKKTPGVAKPSFNILMLFVTEHESVERQLKRGREMQAKGLPVRETDVDPEKTRTSAISVFGYVFLFL